MSRCIECMEEIGSADPCPYCERQQRQETPPFLLRPGTVLDNRYIVGCLIDAGGFGNVYNAWDSQFDVRRAIKEFFPHGLAHRDQGSLSIHPRGSSAATIMRKGVELSLQEGRMLARLAQEEQGATSFVHVVGAFTAHGTVYLAMEFVPGPTLESFLDQKPGGKIPWDVALDLMRPLLAGLSTLHKRRIYHLDVAPDNIIFTQDRYLKLIDFGGAKYDVAERSHSIEQIVKAGYSPVEKYANSGVTGPWSDVYSAGAVLYRAVTGQPPAEAVLRRTPDPLRPPRALAPDLPPWLDSVILKSLQVDQKDRYQSIDSFWAALNRSEARKEPEPTLRPTPGHDPDPQPSRRVWLIAAGVGAVGAATFAIWPDPAPTLSPDLQILFFRADPPVSRPGEDVLVSWVTSGADEVRFQGGGLSQRVNSTDSITVRPTSTTVYTLRLTTSDGDLLTQDLELPNSAAHTGRIEVEPAVSNAGDPIQIRWEADSSGWTIQSRRSQSWSGLAASGSKVDRPTNSDTYSLIAPDGTTIATADVAVSTAAPEIDFVTPFPPLPLEPGITGFNVSWKVRNAERVELTGGPGGTQSSTQSQGQFEVFRPTETTTLVFRAIAPSGRSVERSLTVNGP